MQPLDNNRHALFLTTFVNGAVSSLPASYVLTTSEHWWLPIPCVGTAGQPDIRRATRIGFHFKSLTQHEAARDGGGVAGDWGRANAGLGRIKSLVSKGAPTSY